MEKNKEALKALNQLLQGEYMAVDAFNVFISKTENEKIKSTLQEIQKRHRENISSLASYIQDLHGKPKENLGLKGFMADFKLDMELASESDFDIIKKAINGETQGINMAEKVLRGNLDDESRKIAGEILENDRLSLDKLKTLS